MRIEWLKAALNNLEEEAAYLSLHNPTAASEFVAAIQSAVNHLAEFPAIGREGRLSGTRE